MKTPLSSFMYLKQMQIHFRKTASFDLVYPFQNVVANGVAAQIEKDVPAALFLHCFAHCTNLCLQTIGRQCAPVQHALDLVMGISQLIHYSPKRTSLFLSLQSQLSSGSTTTLKPLCPTRWTVRTAAISAVLTNYSVLCVALEEINTETHDEYGLKAGGYLAQMESFSTYFGLKLSHLLFSGAEQLSLTLQGKDTTIQEAAELTVQHLLIALLTNFTLEL